MCNMKLSRILLVRDRRRKARLTGRPPVPLRMGKAYCPQLVAELSQELAQGFHACDLPEAMAGH